MPFLSLAVLPSSTSFLADVSEWSSPIFSDLLPFAIFAIGFILGIALVAFLPAIVGKIFHHNN